MKITNQFKSLKSEKLQTYFSNKLQLADILEWILEQTGPASLYITTFSTSEEFLRRVYRIRSKGLIKSATLLVDLKASKKTLNLYAFIANVFDTVYLADNHSKVALIFNDYWHISIITSQNNTRGNRAECGMLSTDLLIFSDLLTSIKDFEQNNSISINDLLDRTT